MVCRNSWVVVGLCSHFSHRYRLGRYLKYVGRPNTGKCLTFTHLSYPCDFVIQFPHHRQFVPFLVLSTVMINSPLLLISVFNTRISGIPNGTVTSASFAISLSYFFFLMAYILPLHLGATTAIPIEPFNWQQLESWI